MHRTEGTLTSSMSTVEAIAHAHKRLPVLDGLKGLAILAILVYHFTQQFPVPFGGLDRIFYWLCSAGWSAIELFFVLSGFFVTRALLESRTDKGYFVTFYARRGLRLVPLHRGLTTPALVAFIAASVGASWLLAFTSWHLYEKHFPRLLSYFRYDKRCVASTVCNQ